MSSKIGTILSLIFVSIFFIFGIDLLTIQVAYANLDSKAISISYLISKRGTLNDGLIDYIETTYNVEFICLSNCSPLFGDTVDYQLITYVDPIVLSESDMKIGINRQAIIGYYN